MIRPTQTFLENHAENARTQRCMASIADIDEFVRTLRDSDNADGIKRALSDAYDNATAKWAELTGETDDMGYCHISEPEDDLAADRRADAKAINAENRRMR